MPGTVRIDLRITSDEKAVWGAAAARAGLPLLKFIRTRVNEGIAASERPAAPGLPITAPTAQAAVAPTVPQQPVVPLHPLAALLFPAWPNGLCADCTPSGRPCCGRCRARNGLAI